MATRVGGPGGARIKGSCPQETGGSLQTSWQLIKGQRMETSPVQSPESSEAHVFMSEGGCR